MRTVEALAVALIVVLGLAIPDASPANPPGIPAQLEILQDQVGGLQDDVDDLQTQILALQGSVADLQTDVTGLGTQLGDLQTQVELLTATLEVEASTNTEICDAAPVQCTFAHSADPATSANHNPVGLFVQVSLNGEGVPALNAADFTMPPGFFPAGGGEAGICDSATCGPAAFARKGSGLYQLFIDRQPAGNWNAGTYAYTLEVEFTQDGTTFTGTTLITFTIP